MKNGYIPKLISHDCHLYLCFNSKHLLDEPDEINKSREKCHKLLEKLKRQWKTKKNKKKKTNKLFVDTCEHEPICFMNVGEN